VHYSKNKSSILSYQRTVAQALSAHVTGDELVKPREGGRKMTTKHRSNAHFPAMRMAIAGVVVVLLINGCGGVRTRGSITTGFSGHELFAGKTVGSTTTGTLFAGKDNNVCNGWTINDNGGAWTASLSYVGAPGIDSSGANVTGGKWLWQQASDVIHSGSVKEGKVSWPASSEADLGCGKGVASVMLSLKGLSESGNFTGCLDDTHLDPRAQPFVFPPKIWGTLKLQPD
jgi:hypothetical protein